MIPVHVTVGMGAWIAQAKTKLIACPHVGDSIEVQGKTVMCERVHIDEDAVFVTEVYRFQSAEAAKHYFEAE